MDRHAHSFSVTLSKSDFANPQPVNARHTLSDIHPAQQFVVSTMDQIGSRLPPKAMAPKRHRPLYEACAVNLK
jgi:hypothetical protein